MARIISAKRSNMEMIICIVADVGNSLGSLRLSPLWLERAHNVVCFQMLMSGLRCSLGGLEGRTFISTWGRDSSQ